MHDNVINSQRIWIKQLKNPSEGLLGGGGFTTVQVKDQYHARDHKQCWNKFSLRGMQAEDVILGIHPDLFDKESFETVQNEIKPK